MAATWKKIAFEDDVILKSVVTALGDILVGTGTAAVDNLALGTDGYVLTAHADHGNGMGMEWAAPGAPAAHKLNIHIAADGAVDFGAQQAHDVVLDTYATAVGLPSPAVIGQIAWATDTLHPYVCIAAS